MMKRKLILLLGGALFFLPLSAQEAGLKELSDRILRMDGLHAAFRLVLPGPGGQAVDYAGTLAARGEAYRIETGEMTVCCDGETVWTYMPSRDEVVVEKADQEGFLSTPVALLSFSDDDFRVTERGTAMLDGKSCRRLTLEPLRDVLRKEVRSVAVCYDDALLPVLLRLTGPDGAVTEFYLEKIRPLREEERAGFSFSTEGVGEVIDFRE